MTNDEELTKYMTLIEQYKDQMNQLELQSQYVNAAIADYNKAKMTVEKLNNLEKGSEILLPIGGGTFINANTNDTSNILVDIGAGIITEKKSEDAIKKIDKRIEDLQKTNEKLIQMIQNIQAETSEIYSKAQKIMEKQKS
jgi:prefoldin alpha subunit